MAGHKYCMRTHDQIDKIKQRIEDPYEIKNFLSTEEQSYLINLFESNKNDINSPTVYKNTGPVTLDLMSFKQDPVVNNLINKLTFIIVPFKITAAFFFFTDYPHIIHNDDTFELPESVYKGITIPLRIDGNSIPKLCFFDQFYFHGPAKFFNGDENIPTYYNKQVYEYSQVDGVVDNMYFDESTRCSYLTHLKPKWLKGLTFWGTLNWKPGSALVFDSTRLHCASDFRQQGIKSKLGISIFTKL
jgi:hypothetical protein